MKFKRPSPGACDTSRNSCDAMATMTWASKSKPTKTKTIGPLRYVPGGPLPGKLLDPITCARGFLASYL